MGELRATVELLKTESGVVELRAELTAFKAEVREEMAALRKKEGSEECAAGGEGGGARQDGGGGGLEV